MRQGGPFFLQLRPQAIQPGPLLRRHAACQLGGLNVRGGSLLSRLQRLGGFEDLPLPCIQLAVCLLWMG